MRKILVYITFLLVSVSCSRDERPEYRHLSEDDEISAFFGCQVEPLDSGMTKSAYIASSFDDAKITGITLAVYDNSTGELHYRKHFTSGFEGMELKLREGVEYDLYALANMGDRTVDLPETRDRLLTEYRYNVPSYADVNDRGLPMTGRIEHFVAGSAAGATFDLRRLFAKVTLNVTTGFDGGAAGGIKVTGLKVGNGNGVLSAFGSSSLRSASDRLEVEDYVSNNGINASSIVFYVPENRQGTIGAATSSRGKNPEEDSEIEVRKDLLTYVEVTVSADSPYYAGTVCYRSFIGEDETRDFNVTGNCKYVWNMTITEDGLVYDDWKIDKDLEDSRRLEFLDGPFLVESGDEVSWSDILQTNIRWEDMVRSYGGVLLYETVPDARGFTVRNDAEEGASMSAVFSPKHNWSASLEDTATFIVTDRYLRFEKRTYSVNPRKTVSSLVEYGTTYSGQDIGHGGFSAEGGTKWTVIPPVALPHSAGSMDRLDYSYDPLTDSVMWTPSRYAMPGEYPIVCSTVDGRHADTAVLKVNDTRWINTQAAYEGRPRETSIARSRISSSSLWNIGYAFGDLSMSDDQDKTSDSQNAGYFAGQGIADDWSEHIGYVLTGTAAEYLSPAGAATCYSISYALSQDIPIGSYSCKIYWKDTWSESLQDYTLKASAVLRVTGTYVTGITASPVNVSVDVGQTAQLTARIQNSGASFKKVRWEIVTGEGIVDIVPSGNLEAVVTGLSAGTATVRAVAMDGSGVQSNICTIKVSNPPVRLDVSPSESAIYMGTSVRYTAVATMADGSQRDVTQYCTWSTSEWRIASIDSYGVATGGTQAGTCTVTASYSPSGQYWMDAIEGTATLTVTERPAAVSIEYTGDPQFLFYNSDDPESNRYDLRALPIKINYADGSSSEGTISSFGASVYTDDTDVIRIQSLATVARIETLSKGEAVLTVICDGQSTSVSINVSQVRITPSSAFYLNVNRAKTVSFYLTPFDSNEETECEVTWSSDNQGIVRVSPGFGSSTIAMGLYAGTTDINAAYDGEYGKITYKIHIYVNGNSSTSHYLEVIPERATLNVGQTLRLSARYHTVTSGVDDGGVPVNATWSLTSGDGFVSVDEGGLVTALSKGTARIRGGYSGSSEYVTITVAEVPDIVTHYLEVVPQSLAMTMGETRQLTALYHTVRNGIDDGGRAVALSWESSDNTVATVNGAGKVTARGRGTATLTGRLTADGETYSVTVTVTVAQQIVEKYRLSLTPAETTIAEGATLTYVVRRYTDIYTDGALSYVDPAGMVIPNTDVDWSIVEGAACAEVNASGVVVGSALGDAVIKASYKNDTSVTATALLHIDVVYNVEPGNGDTGSGSGNY